MANEFDATEWKHKTYDDGTVTIWSPKEKAMLCMKYIWNNPNPNYVINTKPFDPNTLKKPIPRCRFVINYY